MLDLYSRCISPAMNGGLRRLSAIRTFYICGMGCRWGKEQSRLLIRYRLLFVGQSLNLTYQRGRRAVRDATGIQHSFPFRLETRPLVDPLPFCSAAGDDDLDFRVQSGKRSLCVADSFDMLADQSYEPGRYTCQVFLAIKLDNSKLRTSPFTRFLATAAQKVSF